MHRINSLATLTLSTALACGTTNLPTRKDLLDASHHTEKDAMTTTLRQCLAQADQEICVAAVANPIETATCADSHGSLTIGPDQKKFPLEALRQEVLKQMLVTCAPKAELARQMRELSACVFDRFGEKGKFEYTSRITQQGAVVTANGGKVCKGKLIGIKTDWLEYLGCDNGLGEMMVRPDIFHQVGGEEGLDTVLSAATTDAWKVCKKQPFKPSKIKPMYAKDMEDSLIF